MVQNCGDVEVGENESKREKFMTIDVSEQHLEIPCHRFLHNILISIRRPVNI